MLQPVIRTEQKQRAATAACCRLTGKKGKYSYDVRLDKAFTSQRVEYSRKRPQRLTTKLL